MQNACLVCEGGGTADKALSTVGQISAEYKVKLSACTTDVLGSGGL